MAGARSELGASVVEYALLLALIALVCFAALQFLGSARDESLSRSGSALNYALASRQRPTSLVPTVPAAPRCWPT